MPIFKKKGAKGEEDKNNKDAILEEDNIKKEKLTWLMFGAAEAGANTLSKTIARIHKPFSQDERGAFTPILIDNIIESLGKLLNLLKQQHEASIDPRVRRYLSTVTRAYLFYCNIPDDQKKPKIFTSDVVSAIDRLWKPQGRVPSLSDLCVESLLQHHGSADALCKLKVPEEVRALFRWYKRYRAYSTEPPFRAMWLQRHKAHVPVNTPDLFDNVMRRMVQQQDDYIPTTKDVYHAHKLTTGIVNMNYQETVSGETREIHLMRAGGQRSQRRKWSHMIYSCDAIYGVIFLVALAEFNLCLEEDDSTSRMHESLLLFQQVLSYPKLQNARIGLVFTQKDLFQDKLEKEGHDISACFPEYDEGCDYQKSLTFIQEKFVEVVPDKMLPRVSVMSVCSSNPKTLQSFLKMLRGEPTPECAPLSRVRTRR
uniref:Uncharacterized protein n=1 Tax=Paramoeba aestuarina TaxID=180227 RepID=A0A7S4P0N2_9EUKA|mmetsp:Transcript_34137/g.53379  ORF Transcript_34137/g.53379 Transcript_34137/m.53379 type:complete len:425 (+) Transcript_34137:15-1289(+)